MKKFASILFGVLVLVGSLVTHVYSQGLPPCSGGVLISGTGGPGGGEPSVYDFGSYIQVISSSLPGGGCAGEHRDCSSAPQQ
ncbi:hypothetical protein [Algoriphagus halophilus]|uniref:Uncharacterized protein n=1 Tax=Algoriphagus halophilus TaxID=226505 RepID=A0A1N6D9L3_9BACT|nr:hypothetical protein [Algoriphagus halophilus]SIN67492.1 hypothetical protein SAMN05444394_0551 [Algoriphagus halophilus]